MNFVFDFFNQEVPKSSKAMPAYYRKSLFCSEILLGVYFLMSIVLLGVTTGKWELPPFLVLAATVVSLLNIDRMSARWNLACFSAIIGLWLTWYVYMFGWAAGSPHVLIPILPLAFFNIYEPPRGKVCYFLGLVAFRILLFAYTLTYGPVSGLNQTANLVLQILNSVLPLLILVVDFILFSSSIQASERQLTINNQELVKEAGTDPLTGLLNRRAMLDVIEEFRAKNPDSQFGIAIADIDFFKTVNDTYGHNWGDYALVELAKLFMASSNGRYTVCRWGGEEFCFFLPGQNLDEAGIVMHDLHSAVRELPLRFGDVDYKMTITIGVEEYDFQSATEAILDSADRKLYMGKAQGRDRVVI